MIIKRGRSKAAARIRRQVRGRKKIAGTAVRPRLVVSRSSRHLFVQVVDDTGDELPIPGRPFGFGRLIRAQAAGDYESLKERGRRVARIRMEDA
jgi:hypothetical protein